MKIIYYEIEETPSTNLTAKTLAPYLCSQALSVISTKKQVQGKGQFGKKWVSTERDLIISFCFFIRVQDLDSSLLFRIGTEAVLRFVRTLGISQATIKWPNDIFVQGQKLSGVLCETTFCKQNLCIIIGIGINGNVSEADLKIIDQPATSLQILLQRPVDLNNAKKQLSELIYQTIQEQLPANILYF